MNVRNNIRLIGNLGKDPLDKFLPQGTHIAEVSMATNYRYTDRAGTTRDEVQWHDIVAFGSAADILSRCRRGSRVCIEGSLVYDRWVDKYEQTRKTAKVRVDRIYVLQESRRHDTDHSGTQPDNEPTFSAKVAAGVAKAAHRSVLDLEPEADDDLPF